MSDDNERLPLLDIEELGIIIEEVKPETEGQGYSRDDFVANMRGGDYIFLPTRETWPAKSVNSTLPREPVLNEDGTPKRDKKGKLVTMAASDWLDRNRKMAQITWAPGHDVVIKNMFMKNGGWVVRKNILILNLYERPTQRWDWEDAEKAERWVKHLHYVYPQDAPHIEKWLAHRVQRPGEKINHALLLGGPQGIGKDTILMPVRHAIGLTNYQEVSPVQLLGRFNSFAKAVILRVNEARDLGELDRYKFYEHLKPFCAAPPETMRVDEKNMKEYYVPNVVGVVITTNYKSDGLYLPADDRRTYVAWSNLTRDDFSPEYFEDMDYWLTHRGGNRYVTAYLATLDLEGFDPKAPPPRTPAFWDIINSHAAPEDSETADILDAMGQPEAVTLDQVKEFGMSGKMPKAEIGWLIDPKKRRAAPYRMERCGYISVRNPDRKTDGNWRIDGRRQMVYAKTALTIEERIIAAKKLT